jgi:hypothetical protein
VHRPVRADGLDLADLGVRGGIPVSALRELEEVDHQLQRIRRPRRGGLREGEPIVFAKDLFSETRRPAKTAAYVPSPVSKDGASALC